MFFISAFLCSLVPESQPAASARHGGFALEAKVLEAVAGGPVVVEAKLIYRGRKPITIRKREFENNVLVAAPATWKRYVPTEAAVASAAERIGEYRFETGDSHREIVFVHEKFDEIPAGLAKLTMMWRIDGTSEFDTSANPKVDIDFEVPPSSPVRLENLRKRLTARILAMDLRTALQNSRHVRGSDEQVEELHVMLRILGAMDVEEAKFRRYAIRPSRIEPSLLFGRICRAASVPEKSNAQLVDYLLQPRPANASFIFDHWRMMRLSKNWLGPFFVEMANGGQVLHPARLVLTDKSRLAGIEHRWDELSYRRMHLAENHLRRLENAPDLWIRTFSYSVFGERFGAESRRQLFHDLANSTPSLSDNRFNDLLAGLDSSRFATRKAARDELEKSGLHVQARLRVALNKAVSVEVHDRIQILLVAIASQRADPWDAAMLDFLEFCFKHTPSTSNAFLREVLDVLAQARGSWISGEAELILKGQRQPR